MKIFSVITRWLFVLCLPLLLITASIALAVNSSWLYQYGFAKYDVGQTTGLSPAELQKAADGLISYFDSGDEYIELTVVKAGKPMALFNQREIGHLKDVKGLIRLDYRVALGTLLYLFTFAAVTLGRREKKSRITLARSAVWSCGITLGLMLLLGAGAMLDFDQLFLKFHLISFANNLWQLDPSRDYLIMLFPQGFWYDTTLFCALSAAVLALITGGLSGNYLRLNRNSSAAC